MPMTSAERQRKYRERLKQNDPEKYEEIRKKNLQRIKSTYVKISELSENQQNKRRRDWRRLKKNQKNSLKENEKKARPRKLYLQKYYKLKKTIKKQKEKLEIQRKKIQTLKKRLYRQKMLFEFQKTGNEAIQENETQTELTPNSKTNSFIQELTSISNKDKKRVKKVLLQNNVLTESLAKQYKCTKNNKERDVLKRLCTSELAHRYKVRKRLSRCIGLKGKVRFANIKHLSKRSTTAKKIRKFFNQDDVSRASAGKKETKTLHKLKKQKRYLLDTLKNLHQKFKQDSGSTICYATFIKYKPFYIVTPRLANRDTCICKMHANIELKFIALKKLHILNSYGKLDDLVNDTVCDKESKECMYSECEICNESPINYNFTETSQETTVSWLEWSSTNVEYKKNNEIKKSKRVLPVLKSDKLKNLISHTEAQLKKFKVHIFNIRHQYKTCKYFKDSLEENEIVIHCDFSENYTCKMHEEIQAVHFGASQYQISLHTSVVYKKNERPKSYCTLSDSTNHSPEAIWAHLKPVLVDIKQMHSNIDILHIYSDGPTTQYRQKKNFFLFKRYIEELGFQMGTWNFSESYHGKGPADGVGANIKRLLDEKVSHGKDVTNASGAFNLLECKTKVKLFCVSQEDINEIETNNESALNCLSAIPNTLKIHQIQVVNDDSQDIFYRILSCFCNNSIFRGFCECFSLKKHCLIKHSRKKRQCTRQFILSSSDTDDGNIVFQTLQATSATTKLDLSHAKKAKLNKNDNTLDSQLVTISQPGPSTSVNKELVCGLVSPKEAEQSSSDTDEEIFTTKRKRNQKSLLVSEPGPSISVNKELVCGLASPKDTKQSSLDVDKDIFRTKQKTNQKSVTILSDVKVTYSQDDLKKILQGCSRYNMSSIAIQKDFPELTVNSVGHKKLHCSNKSPKKSIGLFFSSDSEN